MKKLIALALVMLVLFSLAACSGSAPAEAPPAVTAEAAPEATVDKEPEPLSAEYADMLKSGTYYYCLTADTGGNVIELAAAGRDGDYSARMGAQNQYIRQLVVGGTGYAVKEWSGEAAQFEPDSEAGVLPDFSTLEFKASSDEGDRVTDSYTYTMKDGTEKELLFVFEDGKLVKMTTPEILAEGTWPVSEFTAEPPEELFAIPAEPQGSDSPYAWLGYAELPQNNYFDIMATGVFYREYDYYALGNVAHMIQASDINNLWEYDGDSNVALILNGMSYSLDTSDKTYMQYDLSSLWQSTLETQAGYREKGINTTGKAFVEKGVGPVPLLSDNGAAAEYEYYEFFADFSSSKDDVLTQRDRIYFKDGDVYAINTLVPSGEHLTESTEVITDIEAEPHESLFALPEDFEQYTAIG